MGRLLMNCQFCQQPCSNNRKPTLHYCKPCWVTFFLTEGPEPALEIIELWTLLKDKKYIVRLFPQTKTTKLEKTEPVNKDRLDLGYLHETVLELDYLADVNPTNIQSKVQTMLTFL